MKPVKKYAFLLMNPTFHNQDIQIDVEGIEHHIVTVRNEQEALEKTKVLVEEGIGVIEVCGAFGEELAKQMWQACDRRIPIGYVTYPADQEEALALFWQNETGKGDK